MSRVLVVIAHPDDEIFASGTISLCVESEFRVALACVTDGGAGGRTLLREVPGQSLADIRARELARSSAALGVYQVIHYGLSDVADPHAGRSAWDRAQLVGMLLNTINRTNPEMILTHGPCGGYGHPAHRLTYRCVRAAAEQAYFSGSIFSFCARPPRPFFNWHFDQPADVVIDVRRFRDRRAASLSCHQSQIDYFLQPYFPRSLRKLLSALSGYSVPWTEFGRKRIPIATPERFFDRYPVEGLALQVAPRTGEPHFFAKNYVGRNDIQIDR